MATAELREYGGEPGSALATESRPEPELATESRPEAELALAAAPALPVRLALEPVEATVETGGEVTFAALVRNTGALADHYIVDVAGVPADWRRIDAPFFSLGAGGVQWVMIAVRPPIAAPESVEPLRLTVRATADSDLAAPSVAAASLTVRRPHRVTMELASAEAAGPEAAFLVTFANPLDVPAPIALLVDDGGAGLRVRIAPDEALLAPPRATVTLTVRVRPPRTAPAGPRAYDLTFVGRDVAADDAADPALTRHGRFMYIPPLPAAPPEDVYGAVLRHGRREASFALFVGAPLLLVAGVVAGVAVHSSHRTPEARSAARHPAVTVPALPVATGRSSRRTGQSALGSAVAPIVLRLPVVRGFTLRHDRPGQPYRLAWGTHGARHVTLDGQRVAAYGHFVLRRPLRSHTYALVAVNDVGQVTVRVRIVVTVPAPVSRTYTLAP